MDRATEDVTKLGSVVISYVIASERAVKFVRAYIRSLKDKFVLQLPLFFS